jgi:Tol biopolymer transport system component
LLFESDRNGTRDLFQATRTSLDEGFTPALAITALDTLANERDPTLSSDGLTLYFTSNRGGSPRLYRSTRSSTTAPFGAPSLVPELASVAIAGPTLSASGGEMFYNDPGGSVVIHAMWSQGTGFVPQGSESNLPTVSVASPSLSGDGSTLYFHHKSLSYEPIEIYAAVRTSMTSELGLGTLVSELASPGYDTGDPEISKDNRTIVFSSARPGGAGGYDLYISERDCL